MVNMLQGGGGGGGGSSGSSVLGSNSRVWDLSPTLEV